MTPSSPKHILGPMIPSEILELALDSPEFTTRLGTPVRTSNTPHFRVYDYDEMDDREYAWSLVTDSSTGSPLCITRRFIIPQDFGVLFPPDHSRRHYSRGAVASVRHLDANRVLIGIGRQQLILIRNTAVPRFFPWLAAA